MKAKFEELSSPPASEEGDSWRWWFV